MKIGIGITTKDRKHIFKTTLEEIQRLAPPDAAIAIVDDNSSEPVTIDFAAEVDWRHHRFDNTVGIARAKNKCLELLEDCDHIFLFDDDTYPKVQDWYLPYVLSPEPHLMYIFKDFAVGRPLNDTAVLYEDESIVAYSHARGCMLYFDKVCLEKVGGMDLIFGGWGYEHPELSNRIFNAGLTRFRYMDIPNSDYLIHASDEYGEVSSTTAGLSRRKWIDRNKPIYEAYMERTTFVPYREGTADYIITTFLTGTPDPQRHTTWEFKPELIEALVKSCISEGVKLLLLTDCEGIKLPEHWLGTVDVSWVRPAKNWSPYWYRWLIIRDFIKANLDTKLGRVFCVDATDVEVLKNPFAEELEPNLYFGDEPSTLWNTWMRNHHPAPFLQTFFAENRRVTLLNAGILGGHAPVVLMFLDKLIEEYCKNLTDVQLHRAVTVGTIDMGLFNYVARTYFNSLIVHGPKVNTTFKANEYNDTAWFKHK